MDKSDLEIFTPLEKRVADIKNEIDLYVALCSAQSNNANKMLESLPSRLQVKLSEIYRQMQTMTSSDVFSLSAVEIHQLYLAYLNIISYINTIISYTPTKAEFLAFSRINANDFSNLLENGAEKVQQECIDIDNDLVNLTLSAAEKGTIKEKSGTIRLKAKGGIGHSLVEIGDTESVIDRISKGVEEKQLRYEFENIIDMKKQIDSKK